MIRIRWGDILAEVVADWIAHVIYSVGTVAIIAAGFPFIFGRSYGAMVLMLHPEFWVFACVLGILIALIGPGMYRRYRQRGLGKLDEIRESSRAGFPEDVPFAIPAQNSRRPDDEHV